MCSERMTGASWQQVRGESGDEAHLVVESQAKAIITIGLSLRVPQEVTYTVRRPDTNSIGEYPTFRDACHMASTLAGAMAVVPVSIIEHFDAQHEILSTTPFHVQFEAKTVRHLFDENSPVLDQVCALLDEVIHARLSTVRDISNDWPVNITVGSFRPDLLTRVEKLLATVGFKPGPMIQ